MLNYLVEFKNVELYILRTKLMLNKKGNLSEKELVLNWRIGNLIFP